MKIWTSCMSHLKGLALYQGKWDLLGLDGMFKEEPCLPIQEIMYPCIGLASSPPVYKMKIQGSDLLK